MDAEGPWGRKTTETAVKMAVTKATVVKKPKVFWILTTVECILATVPRAELRPFSQLAQLRRIALVLSVVHVLCYTAKEHLAGGRYNKVGVSK